MTVALFWTRIHAQMIFAGHRVYRHSPLVGILHLPTTSNAAMRIKCVILFPSIISLLEGYGHSQKQKGLQWSLRKRRTIRTQFVLPQQLCPNFQRKQCLLLQQPSPEIPAKSRIPEPVRVFSPPLPAPCAQVCLSGKILATQRDGMNGTYNYPRNQCPET